MQKNHIIIALAALVVVSVVVAVLALVVFKDNEQNQESTNADQQGDILTFQIEPYLEDCVGVAPQKCMVVNNELFYDQIEGFEYQEGTEYTITVRQVTREEPVPQDVGIYTYELVEILEEK